MIAGSKWKLACLAVCLCVAFGVLYRLSWHLGSGTAILNPVAGICFGLALSIGLGIIPLLMTAAMAAAAVLYSLSGVDPRLAIISVPLSGLILALVIRMVARRVGPAPSLNRLNEVLWFVAGAFLMASLWATVHIVVLDGLHHILTSPGEVEFVFRQIFKEVTGILIVGPVTAVYLGPWIRRWLQLTSKPGSIPSRRDYRDTAILLALFWIAFLGAALLKSAWQINFYYICLLPLLYFAAQRGIAVTTLSVFGCGMLAMILWKQFEMGATLPIADLRTLLAGYAMAALVLAGQAGERIHAFRVQGDLVRQLRRLTAHLESVREDEQTRIAREVHDELGGLLTGLKLDLGMLRRRLAPGSESDAIAECHRLAASVDTIISTVQRIATELRPGVLDNLGLAAAVQWLAQDFERRTGTRCVASPIEEVQTSRELATAVYKILLEALTNVTRHSGATQVWISLTQSGGTVELRVEDNGRGIAEEHLIAGDSLGLTGMRERAAAFGGDLDIERVSRGGTVVLTRIPQHVRKAVGAAS